MEELELAEAIKEIFSKKGICIGRVIYTKLGGKVLSLYFGYDMNYNKFKKIFQPDRVCDKTGYIDLSSKNIIIMAGLFLEFFLASLYDSN